MGRCNEILKEYLKNSSLHGVRFLIDERISFLERVFWFFSIIISWIGSGVLIMSALDAFHNNAISFVVESSYRDWTTDFPAVVVCQSKNNDKIQEVAETLWGADHDFTLEEVLSELAFFRGESYHAIRECGPEIEVDCINMNFSDIAHMIRSTCEQSFERCRWNDEEFNCCEYFLPMETKVGICFALNSFHVDTETHIKRKRLNTISNKYTGPGKLYLELTMEANIYTIGEEEVPNLVTPKTEILAVGPYISYTRMISVKNIENDPLTRDVSVEQRNCRYSDENILDVHHHYSYSACSVQCRKDKQLRVCNCTNHLMPHVPISMHCDVEGLRCLNDHYEELSVVIAKWSVGKKGVVCDCLPSCTEVDIGGVHDTRDNTYGNSRPLSRITIGLASLPTERYKRNVIRGKLDLVVSMGGTAGFSLEPVCSVSWKYFIISWFDRCIESPNRVRTIFSVKSLSEFYRTHHLAITWFDVRMFAYFNGRTFPFQLNHVVEHTRALGI